MVCAGEDGWPGRTFLAGIERGKEKICVHCPWQALITRPMSPSRRRHPTCVLPCCWAVEAALHSPLSSPSRHALAFPLAYGGRQRCRHTGTSSSLGGRACLWSGLPSTFCHVCEEGHWHGQHCCHGC